jgi:hypothetical protein
VLIANIKNMTTGQRKEIMKRDEVCSKQCIREREAVSARQF